MNLMTRLAAALALTLIAHWIAFYNQLGASELPPRAGDVEALHHTARRP
ncbi:hypothetical protein I5U56_02285 [Stenotrophomonas maltophilia]|nr:hypothetical protein [Stenotrophomonas maltophilia]MBH1599513.1 hypothetical protein [Stenotrophomonas maltophilia]